jgi:hypothetical protein
VQLLDAPLVGKDVPAGLVGSQHTAGTTPQKLGLRRGKALDFFPFYKALVFCYRNLVRYKGFARATWLGGGVQTLRPIILPLETDPQINPTVS